MQRRTFLLGTTGAAALASFATSGCQPASPYAHITGGFTGINIERGHALRDALVSHASDQSTVAHTTSPDTTHRTRIVIAGGGIAGLAAARALRLAGIHDYALLELEDTAGGNSRGTTVRGITCPQGAHYLPTPGDAARDVQDWLEELGIRQRIAGRWQYDERYLCHSPQERLYLHQHWQYGLLPTEGVPASTTAQYHRFAKAVRAAQAQAPYTMPTLATWSGSGGADTGMPAAHLALDALPFAQWLGQQGLDDTYLLWYLNYCCRDDYGAGIAHVSAWAGVHYFASRHGFGAPEGDGEGVSGHNSSTSSAQKESEADAVLTWPEGNGWLSQKLAAPIIDNGALHSGMGVLRITETKHGVEVDALDYATGRAVRWQAERCIVALPIHIASRVVAQPPDWLTAAAQHITTAPWLVSNIHIKSPLLDQPSGAPMAWDNVLYTGADSTAAGSTANHASGNITTPTPSTTAHPATAPGGLGYVHAGHQLLDPIPAPTAPTVLTYYQALGDMPNSRAQLVSQPWSHWAHGVLAALSVPHPDIAHRTTHIDITRYGHAMAIPRPGTASFMSKIGLYRSSLNTYLLSNGERNRIPASPATQRLVFAHSDWAGYSVLEEAFTRGHAAGLWAAQWAAKRTAK